MASAGKNRWSSYGFTTGTAAAAAAAAAAEYCRSNRKLAEVALSTPDGQLDLVIDVESVSRSSNGAVASVIKEAGPDNDITDGMRITAAVEPDESGEVKVVGGSGVGRATLPGLPVNVGAPAINPMPMKQIQEAVMVSLPLGAIVEISARGGRELAQKTFNPRLGIVGGVSILGTSGIVRPMSKPAWRDALAVQLSQAAALGSETVVLTPGNLGEQSAQRLGWPAGAIVQMSNWPGYMARAGARLGLDIVILGHLGKLIKIAAGYENTHHMETPDRMKLLADHVRNLDIELSRTVSELSSAEAAIRHLSASGPSVLNDIARAARETMRTWVGARALGVIVTDLAGAVVGQDMDDAKGAPR